MDDIYETLIGAAPTAPQKQSAIANQLRRRRSFGELGALTGDRVLQSFGQGQVKQADQYAEDLQGIRQKDVDNAQTEKYQQGQLGHMKAQEDLTRRGQTLDHIYQMMMAQAALEKADKAGPKPARLTYADRNKLESMSSTLKSVDDLDLGFKDEYTQKAGPGPQSRLSNTLSSMGLGSKGMDEAQQWWSNWALIYTLPQRNATFGATLTPTEKQAWTESDINASMDPKQIRTRVQKIQKIMRNKGAMMNRTYSTQFGPDLISDYDLPGEEGMMPPPGAGASPPAAAAGALTPEEQQELMLLKKKHGR